MRRQLGELYLCRVSLGTGGWSSLILSSSVTLRNTQAFPCRVKAPAVVSTPAHRATKHHFDTASLEECLAPTQEIDNSSRAQPQLFERFGKSCGIPEPFVISSEAEIARLRTFSIIPSFLSGSLARSPALALAQAVQVVSVPEIPQKCYRITFALSNLLRKAAPEDIPVGIVDELSCNENTARFKTSTRAVRDLSVSYGDQPPRGNSIEPSLSYMSDPSFSTRPSVSGAALWGQRSSKHVHRPWPSLHSTNSLPSSCICLLMGGEAQRQ